MTPGEKLKDVRLQLGLSQTKLASMLCMTQGAWCNCERGAKFLSVKKCHALIKIAALKDVILTLEHLRPY